MTYAKKSFGMTAAVFVTTTLALMSPVQAQSSDCAQQWTTLVDTLHSFGATDVPSGALVRTLANGQCRVGGVTVPIDSRSKLSVQSVTWGGEQMDRFVLDGLPPKSLTLGIAGIKVQADLGGQAVNNAVRNADITLAYAWDEKTRTLALDHLRVRFPSGDYADLAADFENVDLSSKATTQMSLGGFLMTNALADLNFAGGFDQLLARPFDRGRWGSPKDHVKQVAALSSEIDTLPASLFSQASKNALVAFVSDAPKVRGQLRTRISATPGLGLLRLMPLFSNTKRTTAEDFEAALIGASFEVSYDPE